MKKMFVYIMAILIVFATMSVVSAGNTSQGPYVSVNASATPQIVKGPITFNAVTKVGVGKCDSMTSTITAMKFYAFTATAAAGIASVYLAVTYAASGNLVTPTAFTSASSYYTICTEANSTTINPSACTVMQGSGNSLTVFTNTLTGVVRGIAIGY